MAFTTSGSRQLDQLEAQAKVKQRECKDAFELRDEKAQMIRLAVNAAQTELTHAQNLSETIGSPQALNSAADMAEAAANRLREIAKEA